jgi:hypothetical protein
LERSFDEVIDWKKSHDLAKRGTVPSEEVADAAKDVATVTVIRERRLKAVDQTRLKKEPVEGRQAAHARRNRAEGSAADVVIEGGGRVIDEEREEANLGEIRK